MGNLVKLGVVAVSSVALAGCDQAADTNSADGTISGEAVQPANAVGAITVQDLDDVVPLLDPTVPPSANEMRNPPQLPDDLPDQPPEISRNVPQ